MSSNTRVLQEHLFKRNGRATGKVKEQHEDNLHFEEGRIVISNDSGGIAVDVVKSLYALGMDDDDFVLSRSGQKSNILFRDKAEHDLSTRLAECLANTGQSVGEFTNIRHSRDLMVKIAQQCDQPFPAHTLELSERNKTWKLAIPASILPNVSQKLEGLGITHSKEWSKIHKQEIIQFEQNPLVLYQQALEAPKKEASAAPAAAPAAKPPVEKTPEPAADALFFNALKATEGPFQQTAQTAPNVGDVLYAIITAGMLDPQQSTGTLGNYLRKIEQAVPDNTQPEGGKIYNDFLIALTEWGDKKLNGLVLIAEKYGPKPVITIQSVSHSTGQPVARSADVNPVDKTFLDAAKKTQGLIGNYFRMRPTSTPATALGDLLPTMQNSEMMPSLLADFQEIERTVQSQHPTTPKDSVFAAFKTALRASEVMVAKPALTTVEREDPRRMDAFKTALSTLFLGGASVDDITLVQEGRQKAHLLFPQSGADQKKLTQHFNVPGKKQLFQPSQESGTYKLDLTGTARQNMNGAITAHNTQREAAVSNLATMSTQYPSREQDAGGRA